MAKYMTKQRKLLLAFLSAHADETLPTSRIVEALADEKISASAIYRNLSALEHVLTGIMFISSKWVYYQEDA